MNVWGLVLNAIGAAIVAWGQSAVARSVDLWLTALELEKDSRNSRADIQNVMLGRDKEMKVAVRRNRWLAPAGWLIFIAGIVIQMIPYFRQRGWAALGFF
jgi:hypothetical protein